MLGVVSVQEMGDRRGVRRDMLHLTRGFNTVFASAGEGLGRELTSEDIKKEIKALVAEKPPRSIDEIVLPFFAPQGNNLEQVAQGSVSNAFIQAVKSQAQHLFGQSGAYYWAALAPSVAVDARVAPLSYARTAGDYPAAQIQEYDATAYASKSETFTPSSYAGVRAAPSVLVPPTLASRAYTQETQGVYATTQSVHPYSAITLYTPALQPHVGYTHPENHQTAVFQVEPAQSAKTEKKAPIEHVVQQEKASNSWIAEKYSVYTVQQSAKIQPLLHQRITGSAFPAAVQHYHQQASSAMLFPAVEHRLPNVYLLPKPKQTQASYAAIKTKEKPLALVGRYALPFITALGLSAISAPSFGSEQSAVQKEPRAVMRKEAGLASVVEPYRLGTAAEQPQVLEKIKRELPSYEKQLMPTEVKEIVEYFKKEYDCEVSLLGVNVKKGYRWGQNEGMTVPAASVSKLGLVYVVRELIKEGRLSYDQVFDVKKIVGKNPHFKPKNVGELKDSYTLVEMLEELNKNEHKSSNLIGNVLMSLVGYENVNARLKALGATNTHYDSDTPWKIGFYDKNTTSALDMALILRNLLDPNQWKGQMEGMNRRILSAAGSWSYLLSNNPGFERFGKHGQTENVVSLLYEGKNTQGETEFLIFLNLHNIQKPLVEENMRTPTPNGTKLVNDLDKKWQVVERRLYMGGTPHSTNFY